MSPRRLWGRRRIVRLMAVGLAGAALVGAGAGGAAAGPKDNGKGNNGNGGPPSAAPVLANGVASVTNGTVTATVTPDLANVGDSAQVLQVGSAPIDSAGNFTLTANPGVDAMASAIAHA